VVLGEAGLLLLAWGLAQWLDVSPLVHLRLNAQAVALGILASVPMLGGLAWILRTSWRPARDLVALVTEELGPLLAGRSMIQLGFLAALAGVAEEILFRGVVQVALARHLGEPMALLIASAVFGLAHFASRTYAILAGVVGLYLGAVFLVSGNLLAPILAHAIYDLIALLELDSRYGRHQRHQETHLGPPLST
jgi:membrane protease YdiL (CAAX protease family)